MVTIHFDAFIFETTTVKEASELLHLLQHEKPNEQVCERALRKKAEQVLLEETGIRWHIKCPR